MLFLSGMGSAIAINSREHPLEEEACAKSTDLAMVIGEA